MNTKILCASVLHLYTMCHHGEKSRIQSTSTLSVCAESSANTLKNFKKLADWPMEEELLNKFHGEGTYNIHIT